MFKSLVTLSLIICSSFIVGCQKDPITPPEVRRQMPMVMISEDAQTFLSHLEPENQNLQSWNDLEPTLQKSLRYVKSKNAGALAINRSGLRLTWGQMQETLEKLIAILPQLDANPNLFLEQFTWIKVEENIMYSGYYEPLIPASRTYQPGYQAIYAAPPELSRVRGSGRKYYSRTEIDRDMVLEGRGLELAWAESIVDVYYLQIQGSGKLVFEDGSTQYVNYDGQNGHRYVSSGRVMGDMGLLERGDIFEQREWFANNPDRIWEIFEHNQSYVFFKFGDDGAVGATGYVVDPLMSLASDRAFIPLGCVIAYGVNVPHSGGGNVPLRGIATTGDVGGAIDDNRFDLFTGGGDEAEYIASFLDAEGPAWVLVSNSALTNR